MTELRVDPPELTSGATGLQEAANGIPEPLAPFTSTGTDALSSILNTLTQSKESPLAGMPATKADALATVQKILQAAGIYEQTDQQIADRVRAATEGLDPAAGGAPGGGGAPAAGGGAPAAGGASPAVGAGAAGAGGAGAGGADQLQQMMSMPMQMAQQAGQMAQQVPQAIMQGVQSGMQQVSQLAGGLGQKGDSKADGEEQQPAPAEDEKKDETDKGRHAAPGGAAAGTNNAERAPESGSPKHAAPAPPAPPAEAAPIPSTGAAPGRSATSDPGIVL
jgi:hypothetical protein